MSKFVKSLQLLIVSSCLIGAYADMTRLWPMIANQFSRALRYELPALLLRELYRDGWVVARKDSNQMNFLHY